MISVPTEMQILGQSGASVPGLSGDTTPGHKVACGRAAVKQSVPFSHKRLSITGGRPLVVRPIDSHLASEAGEGELVSSRGSSPEGVRINLVWLILMPQRRIKSVTPCESERVLLVRPRALGQRPSLLESLCCRLIVPPPRPAVSVLGTAA